MTTSLTLVNHESRAPGRRAPSLRTTAPLLAAALFAHSIASLACEPALAPLLARTPAAGVFSGEFVRGMPVYRLPSIAVVASRNAELARMRHDERSVRAGQMRSKGATNAGATASGRAIVAARAASTHAGGRVDAP